MEAFEFMFMNDYLKHAIFSNTNKTIEGPRVTYGEYLRWLGLWSLMMMVIGPSCDAFFHNVLVMSFLKLHLDSHNT